VGAAVSPRRLRAGCLLVCLVFVLTRVALLLLTIRERDFGLPPVTNDVKYIYAQWYQSLQHGHFPHNDVKWQYPPAAAVVLLGPGFLPFSYATGFYLISFVFDVLAFAVLLGAQSGRAGDGDGGVRQPWAAWIWTVGVAVGGPIAYGRYDLIVTSVTICGLVLVVGRRQRGAAAGALGGGLLGLGAMLKIWPALLLIVLGPVRRVRAAWISAVATAGAILLAFAFTMPDALSFISNQGGRGVEIESVGALPFHLAIHHGWSGWVAENYGSLEFLGPHVHLIARLSLVANVLALGWLVVWRVTVRNWLPSTAADAALVAVLLFVVTSRVISPQYMIWMVGLGAICGLHLGPRRGSVMALPIVLVLTATGLSAVDFPYWFDDLIVSSRNAVVLVTVRNLLLLTAAFVGAGRLWRSTRARAGAAEVHLPTQRVPLGAGEQSPAT